MKKRQFSKGDDWSLFLDRDGVINERIPDDYVKSPEELIFLPGVIQSLSRLCKYFRRIVVVTNQQGIGRGLMTEAQLSEVHRKMLSEIESAGGRIDAIYFSPDLKNTRSFTRKPAVGMGLAARRDFPEINLQRSIMVGDSKSDLLFGKRLGMITVLIYNTKQIIFDCGELADFSFPDLIHFTDFYEDFLEIS